MIEPGNRSCYRTNLADRAERRFHELQESPSPAHTLSTYQSRLDNRSVSGALKRQRASVARLTDASAWA